MTVQTPNEVTIKIGRATICVPADEAVHAWLAHLLDQATPLTRTPPSAFTGLVTSALEAQAELERLSQRTAPRPASVDKYLHIGECWKGEGGIFAGISRGIEGKPDYYLILCVPSEKNEVNWNDACAWASTLRIDGHDDFTLPTRNEQALLFANLKDRFESAYYWSCEQSAGSAEYAWCQTFGNGGQDDNRKDGERRARAVRRVPIQ